jgi:two-component system sensor histidine kinase KdpD
VVDRGHGVPDAEKEQMFAAFQRLGDTRGREGLGLGLAVARGLTEALGGQLLAEDTPGGGLTMVVDLPAVPLRTRSERSPAATA